jgi:hypothetical protein
MIPDVLDRINYQIVKCGQTLAGKKAEAPFRDGYSLFSNKVVICTMRSQWAK